MLDEEERLKQKISATPASKKMLPLSAEPDIVFILFPLGHSHLSPSLTVEPRTSQSQLPLLLSLDSSKT